MVKGVTVDLLLHLIWAVFMFRLLYIGAGVVRQLCCKSRRSHSAAPKRHLSTHTLPESQKLFLV